MSESTVGENVQLKFEAAWRVFASTCAEFVAPEATYQAWFAHFLISMFGIDRVAREPIFKHKAVEVPHHDLVPGGEVKLDIVVTRTHGLALPHYVHRGEDLTGLHTLREIAVITELKVAATQGGGLSQSEVAQDVYKLSMLLHEHLRRTAGESAPVPLAYLCILDNHPGHRFNRPLLEKRLASYEELAKVEILYEPEHHKAVPS